MKKLFVVLVLLIFQLNHGQNLYQNLDDGSTGIVSGYGAWGAHTYTRDASIDVPGKGIITFYHPDIAMQQLPVVYYISGWGRQYDTYDKFFKYIASLGYAVVNIYNYNPGSINSSYQNSLDMIQQATTTYSGWIDTSKVGLMGHSYGGGSTIWLGKQIFDSSGLNWGVNGRFIMTFAPWLSFIVTDTDLQNYPAGVKLLILQSYDDLSSGGPMYNTDPRALRAVYQLINIPDSDKDFVTMFSDNDVTHQYTYSGNTYSYDASHFVCYTGINDGAYYPFDAFDVYSSNRLADAMLKYVFEGDVNAKLVALGNGSAVQKDMGIMPDLAVTDYYVTNRTESQFEYKCSESASGTWGDTSIWHLQNYCIDADNDGHIDTLSNQEIVENSFNIFPNPITNVLHITSKQNNPINIQIYNSVGQIIFSKKSILSTSIDASQWKAGIYYVKSTGNNSKTIIKIE